jgi:hypothetical protein
MRSLLVVSIAVTAMVGPAKAQTAYSTGPLPSRIDSRVDSLKYNSNPSTLGPNDTASRFGLAHRLDSRVRSRVDSFNYNTNPGTFKTVNPVTNGQRF